MPHPQAATSWWDDVQHLRPGARASGGDADGTRATPPRGAAAEPRGAAAEPRGAAAEPHRATAAEREPRRSRAAAEDRRSHGTADQHRPSRRTPRAVATAEPRLSRAHAAGFADALDIDGAFGTPRRRFARGQAEEQVLVIRRDGGVEVAEPELDLDEAAAELVDAEPAAPLEPAARGAVRHDAQAAEAEPVPLDVAYAEELAAIEPPENWHVDAEGRRTVRITGRPLEHAPATRRLREVERPRRRTSAADRVASRPDRIAMYAVLLGILLVIIAAVSSSAHPV